MPEKISRQDRKQIQSMQARLAEADYLSKTPPGELYKLQIFNPNLAALKILQHVFKDALELLSKTSDPDSTLYEEATSIVADVKKLTKSIQKSTISIKRKTSVRSESLEWVEATKEWAKCDELAQKIEKIGDMQPLAPLPPKIRRLQ